MRQLWALVLLALLAGCALPAPAPTFAAAGRVPSPTAGMEVGTASPPAHTGRAPTATKTGVSTASPPRITPTPPAVVIALAAGGDAQVNVRAGPGTTYEVIAVLRAGQRAPAVGRLGEWIMVQAPGVPEGVGWVYEALVQVEGKLPDLRTPIAP